MLHLFNPLVPRQLFFEYFSLKIGTHVRSMAKLICCVEGFADWTSFDEAGGQIKKRCLNDAWALGRALPIVCE